MTRTYHIYAIACDVTGDAYVGRSTTPGNRYLHHKKHLRAGRHHSDDLQALWSLHGEDHFYLFTLEEVTSTREDAKVAEATWIKRVGSLNSMPSLDGIRTTMGVRQRMRLAATIRRKLATDPEFAAAAAVRGQAIAALARTPAARKAVSERFKALWKSEDHRTKVVESLQRHWADPEARRRCSERAKIVQNRPEVLAKQSATTKARWADPDGALRNRKQTRWADPEAKERQAEKMRAVWAARRAAK